MYNVWLNELTVPLFALITSIMLLLGFPLVIFVTGGTSLSVAGSSGMILRNESRHLLNVSNGTDLSDLNDDGRLLYSLTPVTLNEPSLRVLTLPELFANVGILSFESRDSSRSWKPQSGTRPVKDFQVYKMV